MTLLLDIGNSRIKPALLAAGRLQQLPASAYGREGIAAWCADNLATLTAPAAVWVANVAGDTVAADLTHWCRDNWQQSPRFVVTERAAAGVHNAYAQVTELGVDRWLALVAARRRTQACVCVIGAGTAMTLDAMNHAGEHLGGLILPGATLMQQSLRQATHAVQVETALPPALALGRTTAAGVAAGSGYAITGLIDRVLEDLAAESGQSWQGLITGGNAAAIAPLCRASLQIEPQLVLEGLAWYAQQ